MKCPGCGTAELLNGRELCPACHLVGRDGTEAVEAVAPKPTGVTPFASHLMEEVQAPLPLRAARVLNVAEENGWELSKTGLTMVARLDKPGDEQAVPMFVGWQCVIDEETGKRSWRFSGARAANGQPMNYNDVLTVLADPSRIWPEESEGQE